ncbi:MAG: PGF-pre-PGF domain-containing protein [Candidatus Methanoperedens sp.]|nr:PGF-pre-PGF domain-containing protein [Candidatus Methanoperedens sp.]
MKLYPFLFALFIAIGIASAQVSIVNDVLFNLDNTAYIKVLAVQNSTSITVYNSTDTPASTLQFYINGSTARFTANANKTLSNISYNNATDVVTYTGNGTGGYLNVSARMNLSLRYYDFEVDGIINQTLLSNASGWVTFNYTGWTNQHNFRIRRTGAPNITSWSNNKTNNDSLTLTINTSEVINFNATVNHSIDTWSWFKDGVNQSNNFDNFTTSFIVGDHTIKVNATNVNGTSNTITWTVTVQAVAAAPNITSWGNNKTNNNTLNLTINASEVINYNATANQTITTWRWFRDTINQSNNFDNFTTSWSAAGSYRVDANATNANGTSGTVTWNVTVTAVRAVNLSNISALSNTTAAGTNATYTLNLTNNGTDPDSYTIAVTNTDGASTAAANITSVALNAGASKIFVLNVTNTASGTFRVNVTATSDNDSARFGHINTTTIVTAAPNITSWGNNKTNNQTANITINTSEVVKFNATANQTITTWSWFRDTINQSNNFDNFTTSWSAAGSYRVDANATNNANGTSNTITWNVTAQAIRGVSLINITSPSQPTNAGTNATYILNLTNNGTDADSYNLTIDNPGTATVGLNISAAYYFLDSGETKIFSLNVTGASAGTFNVNVTATSTNDTSRFAYVNTTTTVTGETYMPPTPAILTNTTGNFWVNTTWQAGAGNVTNSYNVSINGAWTNGSANTYVNSTLSPHAWQNVSVYAFNNSGTGTLNATPASSNTRVANNPVTIGNVSGSYTLTVWNTLSIYPTSSDLDGDTPAFARNFTNGTFYTNNGTLLWTTTSGDVGIHYWQINVTDGFGSVSSANFTVTVNAATPNITSWGNNKTNNQSLSFTINTSEVVRFNATANQTITTWNWFKGDVNQSNNNDSFNTSFTTAGEHTIKVNATNANGTSNTINWTVSVQALAAAPNITSWGNNKTNNQSLSFTINTSEIVRFNATANQTITTWSWFRNGDNQSNNNDSFNTSFTTTGEHTIKVNATNANGTSNTITWTVSVQALAAAPNITSWGNNKTNNATLSLTVNISEFVRFNATANLTIDTWNWFKDDVNQNNNFDNINTSFTAGTHTVKVSATNNTNGTSDTITWSVTVPAIGAAPNITSWRNNKTNNVSLNLTINTSEAIRFNATANQTIDTWNWYKNDVNQNNNYDNLTTNFTSAGSHTIKVSATNNTNGTSTNITWAVTVPATTIVINITSPGNNSVNTTGYVNVTVTLDVAGTALLNWDGTNESMSGSGTDFYKNKTGLLSGNFTFKVYANDSGGISSVSETRAVTVNRTIVDSRIGNFINISTFIVNTTLEIAAPSGNVTVTIPSGTNASIGGVALTSISVDSLAKVDLTCVANLPGSDKLIGENLTLGPGNAHFSPDIQARFNYTHSQITPHGVAESDLTIKFCNPATNSWETLAIFDRNTINDYLIANISHFTTFALIGTTAVPVPPPAPPAPVSVPGGGGGGAGVISPEPLHNIEMFEIMEEYLGANVPTSYILTAPDIVISEVLITPAKNFGLTSIRVEMLKELSKIEGITPPIGIVYKYANIWAGAKELEGEEGVIDAFIGFRVETGWLAENNLEEDIIKLLRWDGSKWVTLDTTAKSRDENFVYYEAKTPGFSPFAIVAIPLYPSAADRIVEIPTLIAIPFQKIIEIIESKSLLWVSILIALILISLVLYKLRVYKKAIEVYEKTMELKPEGITPENADAWYNKGFDLYKIGKYDEALKAYDKARELIHKPGKEDKKD